VEKKEGRGRERWRRSLYRGDIRECGESGRVEI
jgi:hypothetical protein